MSDIITATSFFVNFCISFLISWADLSGFLGSKAKVVSPCMLDLSTPEFAQIVPFFVSVIRLLCPHRTISFVSLRTTSTNRGSLSVFLAISLACSDG